MRYADSVGSYTYKINNILNGKILVGFEIWYVPFKLFKIILCRVEFASQWKEL